MRQKARLWLKSSGNFRSETEGSDFQACWTAPLSPPAEPDLVYETVPQSDSSVSKESACNAGDLELCSNLSQKILATWKPILIEESPGFINLEKRILGGSDGKESA